jgi:hypothetical protein
MMIEIKAGGRIWTFNEFVSSGDRPTITEWYSSLNPAVQAIFDDRLAFLAIHPRTQWQMPEFRILSGREGREGLSEIRWKACGVQWRVLGFFSPGVMDYIMLIGCNHRQNRYDPTDALETAIRRKKSVERGERRTCIYE